VTHPAARFLRYNLVDASPDYELMPSLVSGFDCFHAPVQGQQESSRVSLALGPRSAY
jgi:hypothetical protein